MTHEGLHDGLFAPTRDGCGIRSPDDAPAPHPIHRLWQMRFALPTIIFTAVLSQLVNEVAYRNAVDALREGAAFTEARIAAAGVVQLLADAATDQQRYLLTDRPTHLAALAARRHTPELPPSVSRLLEGAGANGAAAAQQATQDLRYAYEAINRSIDLQRAGDREGARQIVDSGLIEDRTADLRGILRAGLVDAGDRQKVLEASIDNATEMNRIAVAILVVFGAMGWACSSVMSACTTGNASSDNGAWKRKSGTAPPTCASSPATW